MTAATRVLVVTAVTAERDAVAAGLGGGCSGADSDGTAPGTGPGGTGRPAPTLAHTVPGHTLLRVGGFAPGPPRVDLLAGGVGPAAAGAATATALTAAALRGEPYHLVVATGIGGGFAPLAPVGSAVVADRIVAADLGADSPDGFLSVDTLGFGRTTHRPAAHLGSAVARALGAVHGPVLTVSTATGTAARRDALRAAHPGAAAEAMEGSGVAEAARAHGVPVLEIRTISNEVGPRDRSTWRVGAALAALTAAFGTLRTVLENGGPPPYT